MGNTLKFIILIFSMVIVNYTKDIFIKEKDERETLGFLGALKATAIFTVFIFGLLLTNNLSIGVKTIPAYYIGYIFILSCAFLLLYYRLNLSTEFQIDIVSKLKNYNIKKVILIIKSVAYLLLIFCVSVIFVKNKYPSIMKSNIFEIVTYIFTFLALILLSYMQKLVMENKKNI
ncbi:hypothetical protein [Clostridium sp. L74]|uniref:hypothetical protein n=1 Tax=Clostridium sp. L74 TaxID=1560217 RepID=UPI0006AB9EEE|nr:hypothetical protein [Clostridium sp. L74]KOR27028.1 hypothetical protein ND00_02070 [Clostridium sp. L74]